MAGEQRHPYVTSIDGLSKTITYLRKTIPSSITTVTLKQLGFAPNNENSIINTLRYLNIIDKEGNTITETKDIFVQHNDKDFAEKFSKLVETAYSKLFALHKDESWTLNRSKLITFFRNSDQTSEKLGELQARTFSLLASMATNSIDAGSSSKTPKADKRRKEKPNVGGKTSISKTAPKGKTELPSHGEAQRIGLTVRIEVNLPSVGNQETYDLIFKSIRENLLNG